MFFKNTAPYFLVISRSRVFQRGEIDADALRRLFHDGINRAHRRFQKGGSPVFTRDDFLPVPLIDIYRVQFVQLFVAADGVHVAV